MVYQRVTIQPQHIVVALPILAAQHEGPPPGAALQSLALVLFRYDVNTTQFICQPALWATPALSYFVCWLVPFRERPAEAFRITPGRRGVSGQDLSEAESRLPMRISASSKN